MIKLDEVEKHLLQIIDDLDEENKGNGARREDIFNTAQSEGIEFSEITNVMSWNTLEEMKKKGIIYESIPHYFKILGSLEELFRELEIKEETERSKKRNFKYANGGLHFTIQNHFMALCDISENSNVHSDGVDSNFNRLVEIKTAKLKTRNYLRSKEKLYFNAGQFVFYRTNHKELKAKDGIYKFIIYDCNDNGQITIHAVKDVPAKDVDYLIQKSICKKQLAVRWTRIFKNVSEIPLFIISETDDVVSFRKTQINWLQLLQEFSIIPVKVSKEVKGKPTKWNQLNQATFPVDHRTILHNEIVFDLDFKNWTKVVQYGNKLIAGLINMEIPYILAFTGGKGLHVHVFYEIPDILPRSEEHSWSISPKKLRIWLFKYILDNAGIEKELIGQRKPFDTSCVNWGDSKEHLIRIFGGRNNNGYKTLLTEIPEEKPSINWDSVISPQRINLWKVSEDILQDFLKSRGDSK